FVFGAGLQDMELHPLRLRRFLDLAHVALGIRIVGVHEQGDQPGLGNQIVEVASFAARAPAALVAIKSTLRPTRSATNPGSRSYWPSAQRYSIATFCPST